MFGLYHGSVVITGWLLEGGVMMQHRYVFMRGRSGEFASQDLETELGR